MFQGVKNFVKRFRSAEEPIKNIEKAVVPIIQSSGNVTINNHGSSSNNNNYINIKMTAGDKTSNDLQIIKEVKNQKEVLPNDQQILQLIWKYLSHEDKLNCTIVCKRFNQIVSEMDCFSLNVFFKTMFRWIPELSRNYKTVTFTRYSCESLGPVMRQMLQQLSCTLTHLKFIDCELDLMTLNEFLQEFPLLESLDLQMTLKMDKMVEITFENVKKPFQLNDLKIDINNDKLNELLVFFDSAKNIKQLSLFNAILNINELRDYLKKHQTLTSLSFTKCIFWYVLGLEIKKYKFVCNFIVIFKFRFIR